MINYHCCYSKALVEPRSVCLTKSHRSGQASLVNLTTVLLLITLTQSDFIIVALLALLACSSFDYSAPPADIVTLFARMW